MFVDKAEIHTHWESGYFAPSQEHDHMLESWFGVLLK